MSCQIDGTNEVQRTELRRARIVHRCDACVEKILPGQQYSYTFVVYEGESETVKRCLRCERIYQHLCELEPDLNEGAPDPRLRCGHSYRDIHGEDPPDHVAALAFAIPGDFSS